MPSILERQLMYACCQGEIDRALQLIDDTQGKSHGTQQRRSELELDVAWVQFLPRRALIRVPPSAIEQGPDAVRHSIASSGPLIEDGLAGVALRYWTH
mgnify:FL=1